MAEVTGMGMFEETVIDLSPSEKVQLAEDLWDDLAGRPEVVPIDDWQKAVLARRKKNLSQHWAAGFPWEAVRKRVRGRRAL